MMKVKIIEPVQYEPIAGDARSCWGSLLKRPSRRDDGKCGPMEHYFPKGRTPELRDEVAAAFIERGVAEPFDGEITIDVTSSQIMDWATE